jgi:hypothetical protein
MFRYKSFEHDPAILALILNAHSYWLRFFINNIYCLNNRNIAKFLIS